MMAAVEDMDTATTQDDAVKEVAMPRVGTLAYSKRQTVAQGMLDLALLMANASQLKALLDIPAENRSGFHVTLIVLIAISVALQVAVGVIILLLGSMNVKHQCDHDRTHKMNNATVGLIFFITIINVFIAAFGMDFTQTHKMQ